VGAVGAATGDEPLDGPVEAVASVVGIGGNSGETRNDYDNRSATAGDVGQPGSCPGSACEAPGLNPDEDEAGEDATAEDDDTPEATDDDTPEDTDAVEGEDTFDPHANGKGCDDKLFAEGEPPFGGHETPVGPCNQDEEADGEEPADASDPAADVQSEPGSNETGTRHGRARARAMRRGQGQGHVKHGDGAGTTLRKQAGRTSPPGPRPAPERAATPTVRARKNNTGNPGEPKGL
jgi:hypothetical protein